MENLNVLGKTQKSKKMFSILIGKKIRKVGKDGNEDIIAIS